MEDEKEVMKTLVYTARADYLAWESDQKSGLAVARTRNIIK
jgi:hypothetical protein